LLVLGNGYDMRPGEKRAYFFPNLVTNEKIALLHNFVLLKGFASWEVRRLLVENHMADQHMTDKAMS
jgi:hypothetical protein